MLKFPPYSLGKLIDWKPLFSVETEQITSFSSPYSLGKLIDWKLICCGLGDGVSGRNSLLAREIN